MDAAFKEHALKGEKQTSSQIIIIKPNNYSDVKNHGEAYMDGTYDGLQ